MNCKKCKSMNFVISEKTFKNGTVHLERLCESCGAHNGYAPQEMTPERAESTIIHTGKYAGSTLGRVRMLDRDYILWILKAYKEHDIVHRAASMLL